MQSRRWGWTYRYGTPLLVASIVAVVLSGTGLVVTVLAFGDGDVDPPEPTETPDPPPTSVAASQPPPTEEPTPTTGGGDDCLIGSWRALELEEDITTGVLTLDDEGPTFTYREDGTGTIEFGEATTFAFEPLLGAGTEQYAKGTVSFQYSAQDGVVAQTYRNIFDGAYMVIDTIEVWYVPGSDRFDYECAGDAMTLADGDDYRAELERL
jgi:hypothetical protein